MTNVSCIGWTQGGRKFPGLRLKSPRAGRGRRPRGARWRSLLRGHPAQVRGVTGLTESSDVGLELGAIDPALMVGDFLQTGDFQALAVFDDVHELRGVEQGVVRAGVEPGSAAAEELNVQLAAVEIEAIEVGDLEFAAGGRLQTASERHDRGVVEI